MISDRYTNTKIHKCKYTNTQMRTNESVMRIVSAEWKGNLDWWSQIKIQEAGIWAVIMRRYMNICIHLFNLGEDVLHKYKHWRNIMEIYTKGDISRPTIKKNEYKTWFSIWDCRREWFCPDLNGVTQIAFHS